MHRHYLFDDGNANSLVFTFTGELLKDKDLYEPEPDFLKWLDKSLFMDVAIAGDEFANDKLAKEVREAWELFHDAINATGNLLELYKTNLPLFQKVARRLTFLPCFLSRHPDNQRFNRDLYEASGLARRNMANGSQPKAQHLARQSWPVRYAYAIITTIDLTLDCYGEDLSFWAEEYGYGIKHLIDYKALVEQLGWDAVKRQQVLPKYQGHYKILPVWTKELEKVRRPFNEKHVLDYWRKGKQIILDEMPDFHLRPEWDDYRNRRAYKTGAKRGAIQHAIFKDILIALKTIAGANKKRAGKKSRLH